MTRLQLYIILVLLPWSGLAQPTITSDVFPDTQDTLFYFTDHLPLHIDYKRTGQNQRWSMTGLKAPYIEYKKVLAASAGRRYDQINKGDLVIIDDEGAETYYSYVQNRLDVLGGTSWTNGAESIKSIWTLENGLAYQVTGLKYGQAIDQEDQIYITFKTKDLGDLADILPRGVTEVKISGNVDRRIEVNGFGQLQLPTGYYDVLRLDIIDNFDLNIDFRQGDEWVRGEEEIAYRLIGGKHREQIEFVNSEIKHPVVRIHMGDDGEASRVEYVARAGQAHFYERPKSGQWLYAYPNPAFSVVRFKFVDRPKGEHYTIRFYNILGEVLFERPYTIGQERTVEINIGHLAKGTYLYSILDRNDKKIVTKRLIVLKP